MTALWLAAIENGIDEKPTYLKGRNAVRALLISTQD